MGLSVNETVEAFTAELKGYLKKMIDFHESDDIEDVMRTVSAYSARASHMRSIVSDNPTNNKAIRCRIDQIDPFLLEADRQFKIYSRIQSIAENELKMSR